MELPETTGRNGSQEEINSEEEVLYAELSSEKFKSLARGLKKGKKRWESLENSAEERAALKENCSGLQTKAE